MRKTSLLVAAALITPAAFAHQAGDILVRAGAATISPNSGSEDVAGTGELKANTNTQLGLTLSYMVTDNWAVELLASTPYSHSVSTPGLGEVAKIRHLPPTLMGQYYFGNAESRLRPYIGAGINYTTFFGEEGRGALSNTDVELDDSWGLAGQLGVDMAINDRLFVNASVWYIDIDTDVHTVAGTFDTSIDPLAYMVGLGYKF